MKEEVRQIVKVRYYYEMAGKLSAREYTYYSAEPLKVDDMVIVPVRDTTGKAKVSAIDVPEAEIANFKYMVKTIPAGSVMVVDKTIEQILKEADKSMDAMGKELDAIADVQCAAAEANAETALSLRLGEDVEVHHYYEEAKKLLEYSEKRIIKTIDDARLATDDLSVISKLKKAMEAKRKEKLAPHEAQVKAIRDTYNFLMTPVLEAERITKEKQLAFIHEQERIQREQEEINRKRMEAAEAEMKLRGELTESVNLVEVNWAPVKVTTDFGSSGLVDHWIFRVVDFSLVPDGYKVIDSAMLNVIAKKHHDQKQIPGIKFINEPYLATRTK